MRRPTRGDEVEGAAEGGEEVPVVGDKVTAVQTQCQGQALSLDHRVHHGDGQKDLSDSSASFRALNSSTIVSEDRREVVVTLVGEDQDLDSMARTRLVEAFDIDVCVLGVVSLERVWQANSVRHARERLKADVCSPHLIG